MPQHERFVTPSDPQPAQLMEQIHQHTKIMARVQSVLAIANNREDNGRANVREAVPNRERMIDRTADNRYFLAMVILRNNHNILFRQRP